MCVLRVVPGIWLQGGLVAALTYAWRGNSCTEPVRRTPRACGCRIGFASGFANAAISFSGPPVAIYALYVGWDKDTTRGTLSLYFLGISICTCIVQAAAGLYTPVVVKAALWGMPGALVGLVVSLPVARFVRESVFQGILLVMIAFAGSVCIIRAVESLL
ncbi:MAG: TSUP family transporter [Bilophila wadsworthia]